MFVQDTYAGLAMGTAAIPAPQLLIGSGHAWALIAILLVLCCGLLWVVTELEDIAASSAASQTTRSGTVCTG